MTPNESAAHALATEIVRIEKFGKKYGITEAGGWDVLVRMANDELAAAQPLVPATEGPNELPMRAEFEKWWMELQNEDSPFMDELDETSIPQRAMLAAFCKKAWRAALAESQQPAGRDSDCLLASATDLLNSWAREMSVVEARNEEDIVRLIDRLWSELSQRIHSAAVPSFDGKLREENKRLLEAVKIGNESLRLVIGLLRDSQAQVRREALLEAAKIAERVQMEMDVPTRSHATAERILAAIRALSAQAPKEQR
jgi:hypothetical protein